MKCRYRFSVIGRFILDVSVPIPTNSWIVEFYPRSGRITHIDITVPISREEWPRITPNPTPGVKLEIETNADRLPWIQRELRSLQGLLAVFGFHTIELDNPSLKWIPETEEESTALKLASLSTRRSPLADDQIPPISFDLVARAVMACDAATDIELPLNFFRRGMLDFNDRQFIESFYDFFFVIENQYAEGQFRKARRHHAHRLCWFPRGGRRPDSFLWRGGGRPWAIAGRFSWRVPARPGRRRRP